jgi:branched-chain amino acid transport system substrate-binding protein
MQVRHCGLAVAAVGVVLAVGATGSASSAATKAAKKDPIKIAYVGIESGPNATANRHNTLDLAVEQLNAKGGMDGHPIQLDIYDGGQTAELALTAVKKALSTNPSVILGLPVTAQVQAVAPLVSPTRIPVIHSAQNPIVGKKALGTNIVYRMNVNAQRQATATAKYVIETWKPKKVGLLNTSDTNSNYAAGIVEQQLKAAGIDVTRREVPFTATDLTEAITAMKSAGVEATMSWGFPNINSLFLKQRTQNGLTVPHMMDTGGVSVAYGRTNSAAELKNLNYATPCDADLMQGKAATQYRTAYAAKYGKLDDVSSNPTNYEIMMYLNAAVAKADATFKKADGLSINKALQAGVSYTGVCGTYKADGDNDLMRTMYVVSADGGASNKKILTTYADLP